MQEILRKENESMTEKEQITQLIDQYTNLQRIKAADDQAKEIEYQLTAIKSKLETFGIVTENLDL